MIVFAVRAGVPAAGGRGAAASSSRASRRGVFVGGRCGGCGKVYVPLTRLSCPECGVPTAEQVELPDTGTVTTFAINNLPDPRAPEVPFVSAYILLDGSRHAR